MSFQQFLTILNARKKIAIFTFLITILMTVAITMVWPKTYEAKSSIVVNFKGVDLITGQASSSQLATQSTIVKSRKVALKVVESLRLYANQGYIESYHKSADGKWNIRDWVAEQLLKSLSVRIVRGNNVMDISYESSNPEFAATIVNAFAEAYIQTNLELKIEPSKRMSHWFKGQIADLRKELLVKQEALLEYQKEADIVVLQGLDIEGSRLADLSKQLATSQSELFTLKSQLDSIAVGNTPGGKFEGDFILIRLKNSLSSAESELIALKSKVGTNHPNYKAKRSEVLSLRSQLQKTLQTTQKKIQQTYETLNDKIAELESQLVHQKEIMLKRSQAKNRLNLLEDEVSAVEGALKMAYERLNQTSLEGKSSESAISILTKANAPLSHSKPKLFKNIFLSIVLGGGLALGMILLLEFWRRKVRTNDDVIISVGLPVLGEILHAEKLK